MLFDQDELEAWLKQGRIEGISEGSGSALCGQEQHSVGENRVPVMDIQAGRVYHRLTRYR